MTAHRRTSSDTGRSVSPWFMVPRSVSRPRLRLFCFPHAGGAATMFHSWPAALAPDVELLGVQLPGRSYRYAERPFVRMRPLIAELAPVIAPLLDLPFVLFGHSLGALVVFELTRQLRLLGTRLPSALIVSGRSAPHLPLPRALHTLDDAQFRDALCERYDMARDLAGNQELMKIAMPALRADFEVIETWRYAEDAPFAMPLTVVAGRHDRAVSDAGLMAWRTHTTGPFACHRLPGRHNYMLDERDAWLTLLASLVSRPPGVQSG
jgi:surfactin synthase thioesterase subunit